MPKTKSYVFSFIQLFILWALNPRRYSPKSGSFAPTPSPSGLTCPRSAGQVSINHLQRKKPEAIEAIEAYPAPPLDQFPL
jgi:hypothetical protein